MKYPLESEMPNGATVADWLGTSESVARVAADLLRLVRTERSEDHVATMAEAIEYLEQALEEARAIQSHVAHVRAYGQS